LCRQVQTSGRVETNRRLSAVVARASKPSKYWKIASGELREGFLCREELDLKARSAGPA